MATLTATAAAANKSAFYNVNGDITRIVSFTVPGVALSAGDVIQMVKVPAGAIVHDILVNISSTVQSYTTNIGDGLSAGRYFASQSLVLTQTVHLRAAESGASALGGLFYSYSAEDTIDIALTTITSGTAADATFTMKVTYTCAN